VKELWKPFRHGYYEVSNLGNVQRAKPGHATYVGKILKGVPDKDGYIYVWTWYHGRRKTHKVHQLVATAFLGPCPPGKEVNHKDLDKTNNRWDNLEYTTSSRNKYHAVEHGRLLGKRKLSDKQVKKIRHMWNSERYTLIQLAKGFEVSESNIWQIVNGKTWKKTPA
jgi:HNH endonuclease/NUMOD4 motif-containing protein